MRVEDVGGNGAPLAFWRQGHDDKPSGANVIRVAHQVPVLLSGSSRANQCPLQPLDYSMLCPSRVEAAQVLVAMEYVDGLPIETSFQQCGHGGCGVPGVRDRANDTVGRVRNEVAFGSVGIHEFHLISAVRDRHPNSKSARARESLLPYSRSTPSIQLSLSGALPFDAACPLGRARDDQKRPVILAKDAQGRRSKYLEASTAAHDNQVCVYVGGVLENRAGCGSRRDVYACVEAARNYRHDLF
jgi:hypothetical protein